MSSQTSPSLQVGVAFSQKKIKQMAWVISALQQNPHFEIIFLDLTIPFQLQGTFDVIIQKLMWDQTSELDNIRQFSLQHPEVLILEHFDNLSPLNRRSQTMQIFNEGEKMQVSFPKYCFFNTGESVSNSLDLTVFSIEELAAQITNTGLQYPLIVKPDYACGPPSAHDMCIITNPSGLESIDQSRPFVIQEYKDHFQTLIKVFTLGAQTWIYLRKSLPSISSINENLLKPFVFFNSHESFPTVDDFIQQLKFKPFLDNDDNKNNDNIQNNDDSSNEHSNRNSIGKDKMNGSLHEVLYDLNVDENMIKNVAERIRNQFGIEIFGFDVIVSETANDIFIVDINYFPSYKEVEDFSNYFETFLLQRVQSHRLHQINEI